MPRIRDVIAIAIVFAIAALIVGCNGKAVTDYVSRKVIVDPDTGREVYRRDVNTNGTQELSANASGPTTMSVDESGASSSVAGTHEKPLAAYGIEQRNKIFYGGGALLIAIAAVAAIFHQWMASACIGGAGLVLVAIGMVAASPVWSVVAGLLFLVGIVWAIARIFGKHRENESGIASAIDMQREGQPASEIIAAIRETPIARKLKAAGKV